MRFLLTSYALTPDVASRGSSPSGADERSIVEIFRRMPPVSLRTDVPHLTLEYSTLLLSERVIVDESSFEMLTSNPHPRYELVAATIKALHSEGFVELADYSSIVLSRRDLIEKMTTADLETPSRWAQTVEASVQAWSKFSSVIRQDEFGTIEPPDDLTALSAIGRESAKWRKREENRKYSVKALREYLLHVNSTLVISAELGMPFNDWADFLPFYQQKFATIGQGVPLESSSDAARRLFSISFPEFSVSSPSQLIKLMKDRRIAELRTLIDAAAAGSIVFDEHFARDTYNKVVGNMAKIERQKRFIAYLTLPIGFIPMIGWAAQLALSETASQFIERTNTKEFRWFFLIRDIMNE